MTVTVRIFGTRLRRILGTREILVNVDGDTLEDIIEGLVTMFGQAVTKELLDNEGNLDYCYGFFARGERLQNLSDKIGANELFILSAVAGG